MAENRLYQVRFPLHQVAEWVNASQLDDFVVSVSSIEDDWRERERHDMGRYNGPMAYIFLKVPVNHPWAQARPPREPIRREGF